VKNGGRITVYLYIFILLQSGIKTFGTQMLRKLLSLLFAGLILFNLFGYYFVFRCDQIQVKNEMKGMIRSSYFSGHYEEIRITNPSSNRDFTMTDKDEFRFHGMLYDIISTKVSGNTVIFRCINDTKEEQLLARFDNYSTLLAGNTIPGKARNSQAMLYHIIKHALLNTFTVRPPSVSSALIYYYPLVDFESVIIQPSSPPPWTA
jgi:hypothetical protein